jgi:hypothetical protein
MALLELATIVLAFGAMAVVFAAFNELASFFAGWALTLDYLLTTPSRNSSWRTTSARSIRRCATTPPTSSAASRPSRSWPR